MALLLVLAVVVALGAPLADGRAARASAMAVVAADYVPTLARLPPGY